VLLTCAGESVDIANVEKCTLQYTYSDDNNYWFMNTMTFEEERIPKGNVGAKSKYLKDGLEITVALCTMFPTHTPWFIWLQVVKWNDNVIDCEIPSSMVLTVIECDPSVKGNTVTGATKVYLCQRFALFVIHACWQTAIVETGAVIQVPLFIEQGEKIIVNTDEDKYSSRA
jgi:elongation factor P